MLKTSWTTLCELDDLEDGLGKLVDIDGKSLAIFRMGDRVHVMEDRCPHAGGSMSGGYLDDGCAVCPLHGWAFDLGSGSLRGSASGDEVLGVFETRILREGDRAWVQAKI